MKQNAGGVNFECAMLRWPGASVQPFATLIQSLAGSFCTGVREVTASPSVTVTSPS
ncbi:hypothetical protein SAMN05216429_104135 [Marinobacter persicus]|uniref:Uncharacterized protein n=1 Tax=Marinobacter persicus TaxID=930118 RepID=A0A1I3SYJ8_9GAMM|nr:hypothetical protein SAMN05216429_104135 [Marinobacter persicus]